LQVSNSAKDACKCEICMRARDTISGVVLVRFGQNPDSESTLRCVCQDVAKSSVFLAFGDSKCKILIDNTSENSSQEIRLEEPNVLFYQMMLRFLEGSDSNHSIANDCQDCVLSIQILFTDWSLSEPLRVTKIGKKIEASRKKKTRMRGETNLTIICKEGANIYTEFNYDFIRSRISLFHSRFYDNI